MLRLPKLQLVCLAVALVLPAAAFAGQMIDEADRLIDQARALISQDDALESQLQQLLPTVNEIPPASENAADASALLKELAVGSDRLITNEQSIAALLDEAAALDIKPELRIYLGQQQELSRLRLEHRLLRKEMAARLETVYLGWDRLSASERTRLRSEYTELAGQERDLRLLIEEKQAASKKFYDMKALGGVLPEGADEGPPGEPAWKGYLTLALTLGLGVAAGILAIILGGRGLSAGSGRPAKPTALGWCVLAFGLVPPLLMPLVGRQGAGLLPWIWSAGLAILIAGTGAMVRKDRHWPTWAGLVLGVPVALFWVLFALSYLVGAAE